MRSKGFGTITEATSTPWAVIDRDRILTKLPASVLVYPHGMSATTVKLDGAVLRELRRIQPRGTTLTALVRELLASEIRRQRMARAAAEYATFLATHPGESDEMDAWAAAPLDRNAAPRVRRRRR